jgi:SAM-dependent methyltransferase
MTELSDAADGTSAIRDNAARVPTTEPNISAGTYESDQTAGNEHAAWAALGPETKTALLKLLPDQWSFEGKRVLDFGCGNGRTLRHFLSEAETSEFWGTDIHAGGINEVQREYCPPLHAQRCGVMPPVGLDYCSFDLVWAISVFTHLTDNSIPWLLELHRLLKPGGLLIATYNGRWNSEFVTGQPWNENLVGMNVVQHTQSWDRGGPTVLMSDWWLREHWGRAFEILDVEPRIHNMTWVLLRKLDVEVSVDDVEAPGNDPREYEAAKHNLRQVQRELELTQELSRVMVEKARCEYELSASWRLTKPLRAAASRVRSLRSR